MLIAAGTALVLLTWCLAVALLALAGLPFAALATTARQIPRLLAASMWWGLLVVTLASYGLGLGWPLTSPAVAVVVVAGSLSLGLVGILMVRRRRGILRGHWHRGAAFVCVAAVVVVGYLAAAAIGPVTNYDSGLYHLGAIRYAADFATLPGLANVYGPLGYGNAEFPLAALLGNGPWGQDGFRLLNGLVIAMAVLDLVVRLSRRRLTVGFYVLATGLVASLVPLVALADYWVTSPTQDSTVLVVTVVASAHLADALGRRTLVALDAAVVVALSVLLVLLRPTMAAYALAALGVLVLHAWRRPKKTRGSSWLLPLAVGAVVVSAALTTMRDYVLSGWLQYPLSIHAFDVPWRAADPTPLREATLGFHRDPSDIWGSAEGWTWVGSWLGRLPSQWESILVALMLIVAVVLMVMAAPTGRVRWRSMLLCVFPSLLATAVWWTLTPPSFRFAWGPLFSAAAIPIGWSLWALVRTPGRKGTRWHDVVVLAVALPLVAVTAYTAVARTEWSSISDRREWSAGIGIPYAVAPIEVPPVVVRTLVSGLVIQSPVESDQCWVRYPLCTPMTSETLRTRGPSLEDGFLP